MNYWIYLWLGGPSPNMWGNSEDQMMVQQVFCSVIGQGDTSRSLNWKQWYVQSQERTNNDICDAHLKDMCNRGGIICWILSSVWIIFLSVHMHKLASNWMISTGLKIPKIHGPRLAIFTPPILDSLCPHSSQLVASQRKDWWHVGHPSASYLRKSEKNAFYIVYMLSTMNRYE